MFGRLRIRKKRPSRDYRTSVCRRLAKERVDKLERALLEISKLRAGEMEQKKAYEPRVSTTDPEARIMKTSDGGYAPSDNVQVTTDAHSGLIADIRVTQDVNDRYQLLAAMEGLGGPLAAYAKAGSS